MSQPTIVQVQTPYLKGASLESPASPIYFPQQDDPLLQEDVNIQVRMGQLNNDHFEVVVTATLSLKREGRDVFLLEVSQAGVFQLQNIPQEDTARVLHMACAPRVFEYLRVAFADIGLRANLPPKSLPNVDWEQTWQTVQANQSPMLSRSQGAANS